MTNRTRGIALAAVLLLGLGLVKFGRLGGHATGGDDNGNGCGGEMPQSATENVGSTTSAISLSYDYQCDRTTPFVPTPEVTKRQGFLTSFSGMGLQSGLAADLQVTRAMTAMETRSRMGVVGVLDTFSWDGAVGGSLQLEVWVSQDNAKVLQAAIQERAPTSLAVTFSYFTDNFDQEVKVWYREAQPGTSPSPQSAPPLSALIAKRANTLVGLKVDLTGVPVSPGANLLIYKVSFEFAPPAKQETLFFANSSSAKTTKNWGLQVVTQ